VRSADDDAHGLTAAYAVDALDGAELRRAEAHVAACADCRRDLADFRATAVRLAYGAARRPGDHVWERVRSAVADVRQVPPIAGAAEPGAGAAPLPPSTGRRRTRIRRPRVRAPWLVAAAALAVALVLGGTVAAMGARMAELRSHTAEVEALLAASDARLRESRVEGTGASATVVASERSDAVMVVVKGLPEAPPGMGYQLWYVEDDGVRPAGMLAESGGMLTGMAHGLGSAREIGITMEAASGADAPSSDPMRVGM
jgi:hypothetical protein